MKNAVASNWVAETCVATDSGFTLKGTSKGYTSFSGAFSDGDQVFYSVHDSNGNREAGYATFDGTNLVDREPTATLFNNVYTKSSVSKLDFSGELTIACTFNAVAFNVLWKALEAFDPEGDGSINIPPELIDGLIDKLDTKAEQADLEQEIQDRIDGDKALQDQIDSLGGGSGGGAPSWDEITGKPTEFPPEAHDQGWDTITGKPADFPPSAHDHAWSEITGKPSEFPPETHGHEIADVDGLQDALDAAGGTPAWDDVTGKPTEFPPEAHTQDWSTITNTPSEYPPSAHDHAWDDVTGKPTEYPPEAHTHGQDEVDGLELRLEAIEDSITSGGGFVDAPNDGQLYGRQSEAWAVVPAGGASSWNDLTDKPTEFPPSDHTHEIDEVNGLQDALDAAGGAPAWDDVTGKPTEFPPEAHTQDWSTITNTPSEYPPSPHGHVWDEITGKPTEFPPEAHQHGWDEVTGKPAEYPPSPHGHAWDEITGKPTEFPPSAHNHDGVYQPVGNYIEDADSDGKQYARQDGAWSEIVIPEASNTLEGTWSYSSSSASVGSFTTRNADWLTAVTITLHKTDSTGFDHNFALMSDGDIIYLQAPSGGAEYSVISKTVSGDTCEFLVDPISSYGTFPSNGQSVKINFIPQVSSGSSVHIGATPPDPALEGQQWMEVPVSGDAVMWIYDGAKWLQQPGGKDGTVYKNAAGPLLSTDDLIETLSTLREATKDETTIKGLRDAIGNAVGGLIEKFEAMQSPATQEIGDE